MNSIWLCAYVLVCINCYPLCSKITLSSGDSFDLNQLTNIQLQTVITDNQSSVRISPCKTTPWVQINAYFFVQKQDPLDILAYTDSQQPTINHYKLIDANKPSTGISITYLPQPKNLTSTTLSIYCSDRTSFIFTCKQPSNTTLQCQTFHSSGCKVPNNFWLFLIENSIFIAVFCWVISFIFLLIGYFIIRITIFLYAIISVVFCTIIVTAEKYPYFIYPHQYELAVFIICLAFFTGILLGIVLLTLPKIGYINIGLWVALIFTLLLQNSVLYLTQTLIAFYVTLTVTSIIMIIVSILAIKFFIVICTSFTGAFGLIRPLGLFLPHYPNQLSNFSSYNSSTPWQFYLYQISIIVLTILGTIFQLWLYDKKGVSVNQKYYLEQNGDFRDRIRSLLQFKEFKKLLKQGKQQVLFLKNLVVQESEDDEIESGDINISESSSPGYIEMKRISRPSEENQEKINGQKNKLRMRKVYVSSDELSNSQVVNYKKNQKFK